MSTPSRFFRLLNWRWLYVLALFCILAFGPGGSGAIAQSPTTQAVAAVDRAVPEIPAVWIALVIAIAGGLIAYGELRQQSKATAALVAKMADEGQKFRERVIRDLAELKGRGCGNAGKASEN